MSKRRCYVFFLKVKIKNCLHIVKKTMLKCVSGPKLLVLFSLYLFIVYLLFGSNRGVMDTVTRVQIVDEIDYFSQSNNTLEKGMNPLILTPSMGK